jgi:hypothetical protein
MKECTWSYSGITYSTKCGHENIGAPAPDALYCEYCGGRLRHIELATPPPETKRDEGPKAEKLYAMVSDALRDYGALLALRGDSGAVAENAGLALDELCDLALSAPGEACAPAPQSQDAREGDIAIIKAMLQDYKASQWSCCEVLNLSWNPAPYDKAFGALARLSAPAEKTVPMAMLCEIKSLGEFAAEHDLSTRPNEFETIAARYGIKVED